MKKLFPFIVGLVLIIGCDSNRPVVIQNTEPEFVSADSILATGMYAVAEFENGYRYRLENDTAIYFINPLPLVSVKHFEKLEMEKGQFGGYTLLFQFDEYGTKAWFEATKANVGNHIAVIVDNKLLSVPFLNEPIPSGASSLSSAAFTKKEIAAYKSIIEKEMEKNAESNGY